MKKLLLLLSAFVLLFMISLFITSCDKTYSHEEYRHGWYNGYKEGVKKINSNLGKQTYYEFDNIPIPSYIKDTAIFYNTVDSVNKLDYNLYINYSNGKMSISIKKWYY